MSRIKRHLYYSQNIRHIGKEWRYVTNEDKTLFSGVFKTKIKATDLPEWYLWGRYHKRFGFMSTKGIVDLVYVPNMTSGTFLKDDFLFISYHDKIEEVPEDQINSRRHLLTIERYHGYDDYVFGSEIFTILKGAAKYSGYNIEPIVEQIRAELKWLQETYPEDFQGDRWDTYVDTVMGMDLSDNDRHRGTPT